MFIQPEDHKNRILAGRYYVSYPDKYSTPLNLKINKERGDEKQRSAKGDIAQTFFDISKQFLTTKKKED